MKNTANNDRPVGDFPASGDSGTGNPASGNFGSGGSVLNTPLSGGSASGGHVSRGVVSGGPGSSGRAACDPCAVDTLSEDDCAARIACLAEFMTEERFAVLRTTVGMRTRYMTVLAENMYHGQNAAALIRHCEAFGVQEMHTVETLCPFEPNPEIARGTDRWIDLCRHASTPEAIAALRSAGYRIVATTPHREDTTPETFDVARGPFALVFGTEHAGISDEAIAAADEFLRIPMCGMVESLNVSASAAILIYMLSERVRRSVDGWRMTPAEQARTLCRWMQRSVKDAEGILARQCKQK